MLITAAKAAPDALPLPTALNILGQVTNAARPVEQALVIAFNLNTLEATETFTRFDGAFALPLLPAAVYRLIAVKQGFAPAMAVVVPTQSKIKVALRLGQGKKARNDITQEIWEIRGSLPPDILRELDMAMAPPATPAASSNYQVPRLTGEVVSMTGLGDQPTNASFAQTALGVQSRLGDNWQLGFRGDIHRVDDPSQDTLFGAAAAESSAMQMELRSSPTDAYRVASTKSLWRYRNDLPAAQQEADIRSHNLEWEHGDSHVQVRYLQQQNLFAGNPGSDLIEIGGNTTVIQTPRNDVGVALHVTQESLHNATNSTYRTADVTANGNLELIPSLSVRYGMSSRLGFYGSEWAPRTGAEWKLTKNTSVIVSGMYKLYDQNRLNPIPAIVVWSDESRLLPRYEYSVGFASGDDANNRTTMMATVSAADSPLRVMFTDGLEEFWDGLYIDPGDVRRELTVVSRKEIGHCLLIGISSTAGTATPSRSALNTETKSYITGDAESTFEPSGTTLSVSYRQVHQPQPNKITEYRAEHLNLRVAQDLHLPLDLKLLLGLEIGRSVNSPFLLDSYDPDGNSRKYIGGLAVNF